MRTNLYSNIKKQSQNISVQFHHEYKLDKMNKSKLSYCSSPVVLTLGTAEGGSFGVREEDVEF